jgi:hypothetical protein
VRVAGVIGIIKASSLRVGAYRYIPSIPGIDQIYKTAAGWKGIGYTCMPGIPGIVDIISAP